MMERNFLKEQRFCIDAGVEVEFFETDDDLCKVMMILCLGLLWEWKKEKKEKR